MTDFYTLWVHQIKTPIAAARLLLQEEKPRPQEIQNELFKVEQYVEMVLGYLRTEDMASDIRFEEMDMDSLIREQIVLGQILSNALKYTKKGKISIYMSKSRPHTLVIEDTGIGIRAEDLPRVFEKGFTGYNGREENRSTGIGLYLCGKIMKRLDHGIRIESELGKGTKVFLELGRKKMNLY